MLRPYTAAQAGCSGRFLPEEIMGLILDIIYALTLLIASPVALYKMATSRRWRAGFFQRLGGAPLRRGDKPCVWIHAASVGEANTLRTLMDIIATERPGWDVMVSTTTDTGQAVARERFGAERCFYLPLDFTLAVRRAFNRVRPNVLVLIELEAWPNLLRVARRRNAPVVIINGRMREEKVQRYRSLRLFLRPALAQESSNIFCVQNETYRDRFVRAGFPEEKVRVTGTMKYDAVQTEVPPEKAAQLREALGLKPGERVWVAGCTWPGEEEICLNVHRLLLRESPGLRLVIAPRHIERADEVAQVIKRAGFACIRRSAAPEKGSGTFSAHALCDCDQPEERKRCLTPFPSASPVCLLDTVGELGYVYSFAEFVFVGKSLTARGGHNMLEPAALGVPALFGPFTDNFQEEAGLLLSARAALCVQNEQELGRGALRLLKDPCERSRMARLGREAVLANRGASRRHFDVLRQIIEKAS